MREGGREGGNSLEVINFTNLETERTKVLQLIPFDIICEIHVYWIGYQHISGIKMNCLQFGKLHFHL